LAKNSSFGFSSVGFCVGKNQMCCLRGGSFRMAYNGLLVKLVAVPPLGGWRGVCH